MDLKLSQIKVYEILELTQLESRQPEASNSRCKINKITISDGDENYQSSPEYVIKQNVWKINQWTYSDHKLDALARF